MTFSTRVEMSSLLLRSAVYALARGSARGLAWRMPSTRAAVFSLGALATSAHATLQPRRARPSARRRPRPPPAPVICNHDTP